MPNNTGITYDRDLLLESLLSLTVNMLSA